MKLGLFIGRCQPVHKGHLELLKKSIEDNDKTLILLGSMGKLPDYKNPFPYETRASLLELILEDEGIPKESYSIQGIKDYFHDSQWIDDVMGRVLPLQEDPSKVTLYCGDKDAEFYASNFVFNIKPETFENDITATAVRANYYRGYITVRLLPKQTIKLLEEFQETEEYQRLKKEHFSSVTSSNQAHAKHAFGNPIEPVAHAVVYWKGNILLVKRKGPRGAGQWALPGGYINYTETTRDAALRELLEETDVDLKKLESIELAMSLEEHLNGLSTRTIGVNYLFGVKDTEEVEAIAGDDAEEICWVSAKDILDETFPLFYNHNFAVQRLFSKLK